MCKCSLVYEGGRGSAPGCLGAGQDRRSPDLGQYREWMAGERKMNLRPQGQESRSPVSENRDRLSSGEARCCRRDRKSVVVGKSVSVRVDLGGSRCIKKKTHTHVK